MERYVREIMSVTVGILVRNLGEYYVAPMWPNDIGVRPAMPFPSKGVLFNR